MVGSDTEVIVIGAGSMGSMALRELAKRGVPCLGIEKFGIAHDQGAAGGDTRFYRSIYKEGAEYIPLLREARELWRELEGERNVHLFTETGALYVDQANSSWLEGLSTAAHENDLPYEELTASEVRIRFPQHQLTDNEAALLDLSAGYIRADLAIASALLSATEHGAQLHLHESVLNIESNEKGVKVTTDRGTYRARRLILTPGPWDDLLPAQIRKQITITRVIMPWYMPVDVSRYLPGAYPAIVRERGKFFGLPSTDGVTVKFGATYSYGDNIDPNAVDRTLKHGELDDVDAAVRRYLPGIIPSAVRVGIYHEAFSDDHHAFVGMHPDLQNVVIGCGFSGHGFKMAPAFGATLADYAIHGGTERSIDFLDPSRK